VRISYAQVKRYETKGAQPPAEVLKKLTDALDNTVDFLINGNTDEKAASTYNDAELLQQFQAVEQMDEEDTNTVKRLIDAFLPKGRFSSWHFKRKINCLLSS
jgi:transcriptional regulator with XRE-family HTH domain